MGIENMSVELTASGGRNCPMPERLQSAGWRDRVRISMTIRSYSNPENGTCRAWSETVKNPSWPVTCSPWFVPLRSSRQNT